ncbi:hypothetical protein [Actinomadura rupiterrae]|uniref:hypothetical protein n=1 Tax=Actinomadura rupiterrae TaxID=559627 RepID=UPI0020A5D891|nr:hypothetical protein [Actinomadura rupiterrae]MCP2338253.1 hypothetical protein [Actinomadura rupiterrae]
MNDLEGAIREVFAEVAEKGVPSTSPVLLPEPRPHPAAARRWAVPAAASAVVAIIAIIALLVVGGGQDGNAPRPGSVPVAGPALASPDFIVVARGRIAGAQVPSIEVRNATSGRLVATVPKPRAVLWFAGVTAARDNRIFFLDGVLRSGKENSHGIYRLRLDDGGTPKDLQEVRLASFTMAGFPVMAAAPDASRLMWTEPMRSVLTILDLRSGRIRRFPTGGIVSAIDPRSTFDTARVIGIPRESVLTLSAKGGRPHTSPLPGGIVAAAAFAGDTIIAETVGSDARRTSVAELKDGTMRLSTETWDEPTGSWGAIVPDGSGRHVLLQKDGNLARYDLDTGRLSTLPVPAGKSAQPGAAW